MAVPLWCVAAAVLAVFIYYIEKVRRTLPPGPIPFPLLGNIPHFAIGALQGKSNVDVMTEWKHKYGGVYTMWIGPTPMVLVCDFKTATDAFIKTGDAHAGRAKTFVFQKVRGMPYHRASQDSTFRE
uniref:Cytochrome P450 n=1 Tax=Steinernema glaseri TaxID=37863 RepID=A0A1I7ZTC1_9BILA